MTDMTYSGEYCDCGARMASDGACENEEHDDAQGDADPERDEDNQPREWYRSDPKSTPPATEPFRMRVNSDVAADMIKHGLVERDGDEWVLTETGRAAVVFRVARPS